MPVIKKPKMSNEERIEAINKLIPAAEREAKQMVKKKHKGQRYVSVDCAGGRPYQFCRQTMYFHRAMNRMAKEEGLR